MTRRAVQPAPPPDDTPLWLVALAVGPLILVAWVAGLAVLGCTRIRRWQLAATALAMGATVVWAQGGPQPALETYFAGHHRLLQQFGQPIWYLPTPVDVPRPPDRP